MANKEKEEGLIKTEKDTKVFNIKYAYSEGFLISDEFIYLIRNFYGGKNVSKNPCSP